ncbi:hypothetical protein HNR00_004195 [Methylorubrum rhodinum]|uniref:Uncharacterized protein n=1 Tax=Methylorubrum rhodinum TaxID=29428 RepID=A0A840ZRG6_9HYPH|nr:hypothetical protein [Methylorubrum rhodinum]MBB5759461.1 hypothetical protein [Methylorubrum rhodinum]
MARFSSLFRAVPVGAATLITLGVLAAPTGASAGFKIPACSPNCLGPSKPVKPFIVSSYGTKFKYKPGHKIGGGWVHKHGGGWGYGAAALGGIAVGLVAAGAASANAYAGDCALVRREAVDEDGTVYIRRVRVCE